MQKQRPNPMRCQRCARGRVMFDGEDLSCVQCGWRSAIDVTAFETTRLAA